VAEGVTTVEQKEHHHSSQGEKLSILLIAIVSLIILFNQFQISQLSGMISGTGAFTSGPTTGATTGGIKVDATGDVVNEVIKQVIPTGTPEYGAEIGVSFDDPVNSLPVLARLDRAIPTSSLTPEQRERYLSQATRISCEYCCGVPAVADEQGRELCGCSHAYALRGLPKYLITQHPDWTDEEIYWELTRWKALWYPRNTVEKGIALASNDMEITAEALNDRDLLRKISAGNTADIGSLPNMVGGC